MARSRTSRGRSAVVLAAALSFALVLQGCGGGSGGDDTGTASGPADAAAAADGAGTAAETGEPRSGGTLKVIHIGGASTLDPVASTSGYDHTVLYLIYDALIGFDQETLEPKPGLAESWEFTDPTTLELTLHKGVMFQDGTALDAEAVKFNLERNMDPEQATTAPDLEPVSAVEAVDDLTVKISLKQPYSALPAILSDRAGMMVSPTAVEKYGEDFGDHPVGAGPFTVNEYIPKESVDLVRFDDYWQEGKPYLDGVDVDIMADRQAATNALITGQADFMTYFQTPELRQLERTEGYVLEEAPGLSIARCKFNKGSGPLTDVKVRQAINYATDRTAIAAVIDEGKSEPITASIGKASWAYSSDMAEYYTHDVDKAKQLLGEAGYADGLTLHAVITVDAEYQKIADLLIAQLAEAGVTLDAVPMAYAESAPRWLDGDFDVSCVGHGGTIDPYLMFLQSYGADTAYDPPYTTPDGFDDLLAATVATDDHDERKDAIEKFEKFAMADNALQWPLVNRPKLAARADYVRNFQMNGYKEILNDVWLADH